MTSFLWLEKTVAVCVDQVFSEVRSTAWLATPRTLLAHTRGAVQGQRSPLTEYFMWPHGDAWEKLKSALDAKPWIKEAYAPDVLCSLGCVCVCVCRH